MLISHETIPIEAKAKSVRHFCSTIFCVGPCYFLKFKGPDKKNHLISSMQLNEFKKRSINNQLK